MLDNHQFTLLIVAVGLGALLVSFSAVYHKEIDVLTVKLESLQGKPSGAQEGGNPEAKVALTKRSEEIAQRIEALALSLRHSMTSVILILSFLILLAITIFLWSWQTPPDEIQSRDLVDSSGLIGCSCQFWLSFSSTLVFLTSC